MTVDRFSRLRTEYEHAPLERSSLRADPAQQFLTWLDEAVAANVDEPNAFVLSTVSADGAPSSRTLLLKGFELEGLVFYTNYHSRKAQDIEHDSRVSALFLWLPLHRQVRIEGSVVKVDSETSDHYFASRPPDSRFASALSPQSQVVEEGQLEGLLEDLKARYPDGNVPRPAHWGGYRLTPRSYEFWQGREARFHDRFRYVKAGVEWHIDRLAP
ncbi:MAG TPA: pyridoxamine 5'-phosphate oxidase [Acidimicrobiia bacterium]|nr:pyridoxamine 5'-phosphate oxidase [Acidimicrobiia bacterium]